MEIECTGKLIDTGKIAVDPSAFCNIQIGSKFKIRIILSSKEYKDKKLQKLSSSAQRLFERMYHVKNIGTPVDPNELSHSKLSEERMEIKLPWSG